MVNHDGQSESQMSGSTIINKVCRVNDIGSEQSSIMISQLSSLQMQRIRSLRCGVSGSHVSIRRKESG